MVIEQQVSGNAAVYSEVRVSTGEGETEVKVASVDGETKGEVNGEVVEIKNGKFEMGEGNIATEAAKFEEKTKFFQRVWDMMRQLFSGIFK